MRNWGEAIGGAIALLGIAAFVAGLYAVRHPGWASPTVTVALTYGGLIVAVLGWIFAQVCEERN